MNLGGKQRRSRSGQAELPRTLEALGATWQRAHTRFGEQVPGLWRFWSLISGGKALGTNRSPPFPRRSGADWMALIR